MAAGKPIVSTAIPELENLKGIIGWARSYHEFEVQINAALKGMNRNIDRILSVAKENTIAKRTQEEVQILRTVLHNFLKEVRKC